MSNQARFANPLILFLMPILLGVGMQSLSYDTRRYAVLPAGITAEKKKSTTGQQKSDNNQEFNSNPGEQSESAFLNPTETAEPIEAATANSPDAAKQNEKAAENPPDTSGHESTEETIRPTAPPTVEVAMEIPPQTLPTFRFNRK